MEYHFEPVKTLKYATTEKAPLYRAIMRFLFEQHENLRHYSQIKEIFDFLIGNNIVENDYTEEQLYLDMKQLEEWEAILSRQDREKVFTIEEFKRKRLRFQITPFGIEIENTLKRADELEEELVGSLESKDFERILKSIVAFSKIDISVDSNDIINEVWISLMNHLDRLRRNSSSYLAHLKSEKAEELFKTEEFLVYKEKFTDYLSKFIVSMKLTRFKIAKQLREIDEPFVEDYIDKLVQYQASIPVIDGSKFNPIKTKKKLIDNWKSLHTWFNGGENEESDVLNLLKETEKSIQQMSRYALRLSELRRKSKSRKEDYRALANWFLSCETLEDAHKLYASAYGVSHTRHIVGKQKLTDSIEEEIWEQEDVIFETTPKTRNYSRKQRKSYVIDTSEIRRKTALDILHRRQEEMEKMNTYIVDGQVVFADLGVIEPFARKTFLNWIGKAMGNSKKEGRTQQGQIFRLSTRSLQKIQLTCTDGVLTMPDIVLIFER